MLATGDTANHVPAHAGVAKAGISNLTPRLVGTERSPADERVNAIAASPISDTEGMAQLAPTKSRNPR